MTKQKDGVTKITYSVRLNPDLLKLLRHVAVDENKSVGELLEEGIKAVLKKRKVTPGYTLDHRGINIKGESLDIDNDKYDIPKFLRKQSDE